jgi:uncharacterized protein YndB with AHSA1/START domain
MRAVTRSTTIDAPTGGVFSYLADAANLPSWAPAFATTVEPDGDAWVVGQGDARLGLRILADRERGTVDLRVTPPNGRESTVYMRVLPNGSGSELLFTLFFSDSRTDEELARQAAEVEAELARVRTACEAG